ncbi:Zinc-binding dehydrogenase [Ceratobasidium sp. AG-Ba]|nr:Zinc-binding dehydrogenase [Ceratobasidium sp. AG-Ba]
MKAVIIQEGQKIQVEEVPVPTIGSDEVLVKVHSIAQNPADWMVADNASQYNSVGNILGCDFSGIVVKVGSSEITNVKVGDTVAGFEHGGSYKDRGAFAQYAKAQADLVWKFSPSSVSFEGAATMGGCALWTCIQALYFRMGLSEPIASSDKNEWVLVYGGSSLFSTQLAKLSGYKVVTTVSPKNSELLKSLGADVVIDYKAEDVVEQIQKATGNTLKYAHDTVSNATSQAICVKSLAPAPEGTSPGKVIVVLAPDKTAISLRSDVVVQFTLVYTSLGRAFGWNPSAQFPASPEDRQGMVSWMPKLEQLVNSGKLKPNPVKLWPGGLEAVNEGLQYMREGKDTATGRLRMTRDAHILSQVYLAELRVLAKRHCYVHEGSLEDPAQARALLSVIVLPLVRHLSQTEYMDIVDSVNEAEDLLSTELNYLNELVDLWSLKYLSLLQAWRTSPMCGEQEWHYGHLLNTSFRIEDMATPLPYPLKTEWHEEQEIHKPEISTGGVDEGPRGRLAGKWRGLWKHRGQGARPAANKIKKMKKEGAGIYVPLVLPAVEIPSSALSSPISKEYLNDEDWEDLGRK